MPYQSDRQRAWMHIHQPAIAKKWDKEMGSGKSIGGHESTGNRGVGHQPSMRGALERKAASFSSELQKDMAPVKMK